MFLHHRCIIYARPASLPVYYSCLSHLHNRHQPRPHHYYSIHILNPFFRTVSSCFFIHVVYLLVQCKSMYLVLVDFILWILFIRVHVLLFYLWNTGSIGIRIYRIKTKKTDGLTGLLFQVLKFVQNKNTAFNLNMYNSCRILIQLLNY